MSPKNPSTARIPKKADGKATSKLVVGAEPAQKISLYVRAAKWLKDRENALSRFQAINPKIKAVRHPRQKSADFCFIDFASVGDRDQVFAELKNHDDLTVKPATTDVPKLLDRRSKKIAERRERKKEARALKRHIEKLAKKAKSSAPLSTEIFIAKLPTNVTARELKTHFPSSIDVRLINKGKPGNKKTKPNSAIVVFATPKDAFEASRKQLELHEQKVHVQLNVERTPKLEGEKKKIKKSKKPKVDAEDDDEEKEVMEEVADEDDENDQESIAEEEEEGEEGEEDSENDQESIADEEDSENDQESIAEEEEDSEDDDFLAE